MPCFTQPIHEHGDPSRPGPYPHGRGSRKAVDRDAFVARPATQRRLPRTAGDAAHRIGQALGRDAERFDRMNGYDTRMQALRISYEKRAAEGEANWLKHLKGLVEKVRPAVVAAVEQALADNAENAKFARVVARFGEDSVIVVAREEGPDSGGPLSRDAAAQRIGPTTVLFDDPVWTDLQDSGKREAPVPGAVTSESFGGFAAVLRHEYGHHVWRSQAFKQADRDAFRAVLPDRETVKTALTYYAADRDEEAFSETLAIWADPKFDRAKYPAAVQPLFTWFDRRFGGRTIESAFACPIHEHGDPSRPGPYPHAGGTGKPPVGVDTARRARWGRSPRAAGNEAAKWYYFPAGGDYQAVQVGRHSLTELAPTLDKAIAAGTLEQTLLSLVPRAVPPGYEPVFRIGEKAGTLADRNAANAAGMVEFLEMVTDTWSYGVTWALELPGAVEMGASPRVVAERYLQVYFVKIGATGPYKPHRVAGQRGIGR